MTDILELIKKGIEFRARENLFVNLMGMKIEDFSEGHAVCSMVIEPKQLNQYHNVQGGCLMSLADNTMGTACCYLNDAVTTLDLQYHFMKPVSLGAKAVCTADVLHAGRKVITVQCRMTVDDQLVGYGTSTFYRLGKPLIPEDYDPQTYRKSLESSEKDQNN